MRSPHWVRIYRSRALFAALTVAWALAGASCSERGCNAPECNGLPSGRVVLRAEMRKAETYTFHDEAFSFSANRVVRLPEDCPPDTVCNDLIPDVILGIGLNENGRPRGLEFTQTAMSYAFSRIGERATLAEARWLYDVTVCIPEWVRFDETVEGIGANQVWVVKTYVGRFAKLLAVESSFSREAYDSAGVPVTTALGAVTFDWEYQPDGSTCFGEP
jgi:hypothetical protein